MADIGQLIDLCQEAWDTSYHSHLLMDRPKTMDLIRKYIKSEALFAKVYEDKGTILGGLGGYTHTMEVSHCRAASDAFFFFSEDFRVSRETATAPRMLLITFLDWAKHIGADMITMYTSHGSERGERAGHLLESVGLKRSGSVYYWVRPKKQGD